MRSICVLLVVAWIVGMVGGLAGHSWLIIAAGIVAALVVLALRQGRTSGVVAVALVGLLGLVRGEAAVLPVHAGCVEQVDVAMGTIMVRPRLESERVQYRVLTPAGCVWLVYGARFPVWSAGTSLHVSGGKRTPTEAVQTMGFREYLEQEGLAGVWQYPTLRAVHTTTSESIQEKWREQVIAVVPEPTAGVLLGLLVGDTDSLSSQSVEHFRRTGVSHVLAVSGSHVSLLASILLVFLWLLPLPRLYTYVVLSILLWLYIGFIGAPVSAVRAGVFWSLAAVALGSGWLVAWPTLVLWAVAGMLTVTPTLFWAIGWQLSVGAVIGMGSLLLLTRPWRRRYARYSGSALITATFVSLGATLGTAPLLVYHFGSFSVIGLVANLAVVPLVPLLILGSLVVMSMSFISVELARLLALPLSGLAELFLWVPAQLATVPYGVVEDLSMAAHWVAVYYLVVTGMGVIWFYRQGRKGAELWVP